MVRFLKALLVIIAIVLSLSLALVLFDPFGMQRENRQALRRRSVNEIMSAFEAYTAEHLGQLPPGLPSTLTQIGRATDHCQISNSHCEATPSACADLHAPVLMSRDRTLPSDVQKGNPNRTYYAVKIENDRILTVTACGSETVESISITKDFSEIMKSAPSL